MYSGDFVKLTQSQGVNGAHHGAGMGTEDDWSDQELLLLLEGVEMYDDDWSAIEEHVGSRSAQQCIRKFLELPIEDSYIATEGNMGPLRYARLPFEQADNPVMSVVAFLSGVIGPGIAAEAAKTALHELTDGSKKEETEEKEKGPEGEAEQTGEKAEDKMQEDQASGDTPAKPAEETTSKKGSPDPAPPDGMNVDQNAENAGRKEPAIPHSKVVRAANLALKSSAKAAQALADAEDAQIRSTLANLIKLTLTKLELKMTQFEELEDLLEDERRTLESARLNLMNERINLKKTLDTVKGELAKHQSGTPNPAGLTAALQQGAAVANAQGTTAAQVQYDAEMGPVNGGTMAQLS